MSGRVDMRTIEHAIVAAEHCLSGVGIENPRLEAEHLLAALLRVNRAQLVLHRREPFAWRRRETLRRWLKEREMRKPLAYVCGEMPFGELSLLVSPVVLIPRPETELVVERALRVLDACAPGSTAVDVGTGSGNIALSLATHPRLGRMMGIDASNAALALARQNEKRTQPRVPVEWIAGDLLEPLLERREKADLVVANLPYVRTEEINVLEPELRWEPVQALDGGADGLRLIEPCIHQASQVLVPGGVLLLEIGFDQHQDVLSLFQEHWAWSEARFFPDLSGLPRIIQARRRG